MRLLLSSLLVLLLCTCARAQVGVSVDQEYVQWCMVDSLASGQVIRFQRILLVATRDVIDIDAGGSPYTVAGISSTCETYDLRETTRDPLADYYDDCQCEYTISQENHRVSEIRGGAIQEYDVEFQEVVRRLCAGQVSGVVVHRDTLLKTQAFTEASRLQFGWTFSEPGQYVNQVNFRYYTSGGSTQTISIDLDPNTVQASYPALNLDSDDFEFSGSNLADMVVAYQTVLDDQITGATNDVTVSLVSATLSIFTELLHEPNFPYVTQPRPGDADYLATATTPNGFVSLGQPGSGTTTTTNNYSEECEDIFTEEYGSYIYYSKETPLELLPRLNVTTTIQGQNSNQTAFCDVSPAVCAELTPDVVTLAGECVETCSDVANVGGHQGIRDEDITYAAQEYNSVSVWVTAGSVGVVLDGVRINYPAGSITSWSAQEGKLLQNSIRFDATDGGEAIINYVK